MNSIFPSLSSFQIDKLWGGHQVPTGLVFYLDYKPGIIGVDPGGTSSLSMNTTNKFFIPQDTTMYRYCNSNNQWEPFISSKDVEYSIDDKVSKYRAGPPGFPDIRRFDLFESMWGRGEKHGHVFFVLPPKAFPYVLIAVLTNRIILK